MMGRFRQDYGQHICKFTSHFHSSQSVVALGIFFCWLNGRYSQVNIQTFAIKVSLIDQSEILLKLTENFTTEI